MLNIILDENVLTYKETFKTLSELSYCIINKIKNENKQQIKTKIH